MLNKKFRAAPIFRICMVFVVVCIYQISIFFGYIWHYVHHLCEWIVVYIVFTVCRHRSPIHVYLIEASRPHNVLHSKWVSSCEHDAHLSRHRPPNEVICAGTHSHTSLISLYHHMWNIVHNCLIFGVFIPNSRTFCTIHSSRKRIQWFVVYAALTTSSTNELCGGRYTTARTPKNVYNSV